MANGGLQTVGFFLGYIGLVLNLCCLLLPFWKMDDISMETVVSQRKYAGLWLQCDYLMSTGGVYQCKRYQRFFVALPMYLQGSRGFTIVSVVLGVLSVFTGIVGLECTRIAEETEGTKRTMGVVSGVCNVLAGIGMIISTCWFAAQVFMEFQNDGGLITQMQNSLQPQWVYGWCLWIGWGSAVITLGAGVLMLAGSLGDEVDDDDRQSMGFQMGNARLLNKPQNNYV